ncbi:uncharacterized protein CLAFUR5_14428 [Fulvia fulva]|uniref:Uncharacterized protein n=1 Tax=Passalora fulva TaxID=5499 RepID=A0A9Q8PM31_PASFU|nr:uncharacterized protein CLAFUR5_14428 [Fulvia fulva]UJO25124.1 hypothetical protein CLAFUR5_14428 [Fulvia fulva]
MKVSTVAILLTATLQSSAEECGYGGCTEYSTYETTTPVVTYYTTTYQSVCTTPIVYKPTKVKTITVTSTYTKPGETKKYTSYITDTTTETLPASTLTEKTTYSTEVTDTKSTTIYKTDTVTDTIVITSNNTITVPTTKKYTIPVPTTVAVPTTEYDTEYVPIPTIYVSSKTVTESGTTYVPKFTITETTTRVETSRVTTEVPIPTTVLQFSTITANGTTEVLTYTQELTRTIIPPAETVEVTRISTVREDGTTSLVTMVDTTTLPGQTIQIPGQTVQVPGTTVVEVPPEETVEFTAFFPTTVYVTMTAPPSTITVAPPPPASTCNGTGFFPENNDACGGDDCYIDFDLPAAVHWDLLPDSPILSTSLTFRNTVASQTCITTICNSAAFTSFYTRSLVSCARPPCPSNYLDCDCNIMVGPLVLPNGETTSVLQDGSSGWNLNLGMIATGYNLPSCAGGNPQCVTSTVASNTRSLVYTDDVITLAPTGTYANGSYAVATEYILPQLPAYFRPNDPFGNCQTAIFPNAGNEGQARMLRPKLARRGLEKRADAASYTWPGTPNLRRDLTSDAAQSQVQGTDSPAPAEAPTTIAGPTITQPAVTITQPASPESPAPQQPTPTSANQPTAPSQTTGGGGQAGTSPPNKGSTQVIVIPPGQSGNTGSEASPVTQIGSQAPDGQTNAPSGGGGVIITETISSDGSAVVVTRTQPVAGGSAGGAGETSVYTSTFIEGGTTIISTDLAGAPGGITRTIVSSGSTRVTTGTTVLPAGSDGGGGSSLSSDQTTGTASTTTGTAVTTGPDGRATAYVTLFYSMVNGSAAVPIQTGAASGSGVSSMLMALLMCLMAFVAL